MNTEYLTKALHSAQFALGDLQQALQSASAVEAIIILPMIEKMAKLEIELRNFDYAVKEGEGKK